MIKNRPYLLLVLLTISLALTAQEVDKCGYDLLLEQSLERNPAMAERMAEVETFTQEWISNQANRPAQTREIITIPVVVHVLWNEASEDISNLQVYSQIGILNEDFRMRNENVGDIPDDFKALAADVGFEFCLATLTPEGDITDGITRTQTEWPCIGDFNTTTESGVPRLFYSILGGQDPWDPRRYLNIWVAPTCNAFLGFGFNPGQSDSPQEDGVVLDTDYFGNVCNDGRNHHLGRTTTHEIGHYFNLKHIWGNKGCDGVDDDFVEDTPPQDNFHLGCPTHPSVSCGSADMYMNFMDYTDDACISMFTIGQRDRMHAAINGPRSGLLNSNRCLFINQPRPDLGITVFPNPVSDCIHVEFNANFDDDVTVLLYDSSGKRIYEAINNASNIRSIPADGLSPGVYYLHLTNGSTKVSERILVQ